MQLKIGQKVRLVKKRPSERVAGGWNEKMDRYLGKVVTVKDFGTWHRNTFYIEEDGGRFIWDNKLIAGKSEKKVVVIKTIAEMKEKFDAVKVLKLLPLGARVEKIIHDGEKCIVCFVEYRGYTVKTVTKCHECDEFEFQKGMEIAMYNTAKKIADREIKRLCK